MTLSWLDLRQWPDLVSAVSCSTSATAKSKETMQPSLQAVRRSIVYFGSTKPCCKVMYSLIVWLWDKVVDFRTESAAWRADQPDSVPKHLTLKRPYCCFSSPWGNKGAGVCLPVFISQCRLDYCQRSSESAQNPHLLSVDANDKILTLCGNDFIEEVRVWLCNLRTVPGV